MGGAALTGDSERPLDPVRHHRHVELLLLLAIVEHVNATAARAAASQEAGAQPLRVQAVLERVRSQLCRPRPAWARTSVLGGLLAALDSLQQQLPDTSSFAPRLSALIEQQCSWLAGVEQRRSESLSRPQRRQLPEVQRLTSLFRDLTEQQADAASDSVQRLTLSLIEECFEPFAMAREYLRSVLHIEETLIEHDLQLFIRRVFLLKYRKHYLVLASLCTTINEHYFGVASFSFRASHDVRPPLVSGRSLLKVIRDELQTRLPALNQQPTEPEYTRLALGFFLALRFCELVQLQFEVPVPDAGAGAQEAGEDAEDSGIHQRVRVRLLQPLAYSTLRARLFGSLSGIDGLSEILGGGLLPGVDLGRTWVVAGAAGSGKTSLALHMGADMAAREHLVVYFSFEESYHNISDRVLTFRLYQPDRFEVAATDDADLAACLARAASSEQRGLLLYHRGHRDSLSATIRSLREAIDRYAPHWARSTAIIVDSVDALEPTLPNQREGDGRYERRKLLRELIHLLEELQFSALLLTEAQNPELPTLQHLADTYVEVGVDEARVGRWFQIHKSRLQDFMRGRHGYRLRDGRGVALVPNLWAVQRMVRRRTPAPLSESRVIAFPEALRDKLPVPLMPEKSSLLIWGNERSALLPLWVHILTEPTRHIPAKLKHHLRDPSLLRRELGQWEREPLGGVMVVSFRTPTLSFLQSLRLRPALQARWNLVPKKTLGWYQPQPGLTGARIVRDLRRALADARMSGAPIERIVFDEIDGIDALLPTLAQEDEFWPTIFGLLASEPVSVMYVVGSDGTQEPSFCRKFAASMDYCCRITSPSAVRRGSESRAEPTYLSLYKHPIAGPSGPSEVAIEIGDDGSVGGDS